ncbi:unnamed protein product [Lactuca saligna]|uniref:Uncharacterized protein n=1 Tax=Lactuca saligna TaxID=75948 RepID=A0AA35Z7D4_LACSI|nr:unnamed protein product [Lactuca saligna]
MTEEAVSYVRYPLRTPQTVHKSTGSSTSSTTRRNSFENSNRKSDPAMFRKLDRKKPNDQKLNSAVSLPPILVSNNEDHLKLKPMTKHEQLRDEKFKAKEEDEDSAQEMARVIQRITELHDKGFKSNFNPKVHGNKYFLIRSGIAIYEVQRFQRLIKESWKGMLILVLKDNVGLMESNKVDD